ncbi:hypothetical protein DRQ15_08815, partial [candidate division KSB1 bacterium]
GVMVEVHPDPQKALSDGPQSLTFSEFEKMMQEIRDIAQVLGKNNFVHSGQTG